MYVVKFSGSRLSMRRLPGSEATVKEKRFFFLKGGDGYRIIEMEAVEHRFSLFNTHTKAKGAAADEERFYAYRASGGHSDYRNSGSNIAARARQGS
jgi:hypothetical protein